jgi:hypothetical protein
MRCDGVADLGVGYDLDTGDDKADLPRCKFGNLDRVRREDADLEDLVTLAVGH